MGTAATQTPGAGTPARQEPTTAFRPALIAALAVSSVLLLVLLRTAWISEDAYISFRVIDNFLNGYGLRWNVAERVQTYTDPLFVLMVAAVAWLSGNIYLSAIAVSFALTAAALYFLLRGQSTSAVLLTGSILLFSKGFIDFSVSGMENPATHLGLAAFVFVCWRRRDPAWLTGIAALTATNRLDTLVLMLPALLAVYWRARARDWWRIALAWSPLLAWFAFSLVYYGFFFPNTAYAKLSTGIPLRDYVFQGCVYFGNAAVNDTATLLAIAAGLAMAWRGREWPLGLGLLLYLAYVLRTGGDFMMGRFFTAPLILATALIARHWPSRPLPVAAAIAAIAAAGLSVPNPTLTSAHCDYGQGIFEIGEGGIADERAVYYVSTGLSRYEPGRLWPNYWWAQAGEKMRREGPRLIVWGNIGMTGYHAGPRVHIIDVLAIGDPLLARLPCRPQWRVGHYQRDLPRGYFETLAYGGNHIADPKLREYYKHLHLVITGDTWSWARLREVFWMNLGSYDHLLPQHAVVR